MEDLPVPLPQNVNSSSNRAATPSRVVTPGRAGTPQRSGSAPRATSATKSRAIAKAVIESGSGQKERRASSSRRKQRKWEMDHLFGVSATATAASIGQDGDDFEGHSALTVDWRSLFSELFREQNSAARAQFMSCEDSIYRAPAPKNRFARLSEDLREGELSWLRVQKRLRSVVDRAVQQDLSGRSGDDGLSGGAVEFLASMEAVVWCFMETGCAPPEAALPAGLASALLRPLEITHNTAPGSEADTRAVLSVVLQDSPYHRLLLHALVQFHGLHSKSSGESDGRSKIGRKEIKNRPQSEERPDAGTARVVSIYRYKSAIGGFDGSLASRRVSLVSFLQYKKKGKIDNHQ